MASKAEKLAEIMKKWEIEPLIIKNIEFMSIDIDGNLKIRGITVHASEVPNIVEWLQENFLDEEY